jgi:hypothetical protein
MMIVTRAIAAEQPLPPALLATAAANRLGGRHAIVPGTHCSMVAVDAGLPWSDASIRIDCPQS